MRCSIMFAKKTAGPEWTRRKAMLRERRLVVQTGEMRTVQPTIRHQSRAATPDLTLG